MGHLSKQSEAQSAALREQRSRAEDQQRVLKTELRAELLEQKKMTAGIETKLSTDMLDVGAKFKAEAADRQKLEAKTEQGLKVAAEQRQKLADDLTGDIDSAQGELEDDLAAAQKELAEETARVHEQAESRATLLEKDMAQVKTDLKGEARFLPVFLFDSSFHYRDVLLRVAVVVCRDAGRGGGGIARRTPEGFDRAQRGAGCPQDADEGRRCHEARRSGQETGGRDREHCHAAR